MIGILLIVVFTLVYKFVMRTEWRDPQFADCFTGRRSLNFEEISMLEEYYKMPMWRRFGTYVQLW